MEIQNQTFDDREILNDALISQKFLTDDYNIFAGECSTPTVYNEFMSILADEHQIQNEVFQEMEMCIRDRNKPGRTNLGIQKLYF